MTAKQQIATGFLAVLIVGSVAFMPANADTNAAAKPAAHRPAAVAVNATKASAPAPRQAASDLTYN